MVESSQKNLLSVGLLTSVGALLLALTWRGWPDPQIDFGRELYAAWQISEGGRLYADITWFNGPLSPHINALWFKLFGTSLMTLAGANIILLGLLVALMWRLLREIGGHLAATVACATALPLFGLVQLVGIGNYNFICPYSHELTHGVLLGFGALAALAAHLRSGRARWALFCGLLVGTTFLTKAEIFLASAAACAIGRLIAARRAPATGTSHRVYAPFALGALIPVSLAFALLHRSLGATSEAIRATLGSWVFTLDPEITSLPFYQRGIGLDDPLGNLAAIAAGLGVHLLLLLPAAALATLAGRNRPRIGPWVAAILGAALALIAAVVGVLDWTEIARPWPVLVVAVAIGGGWSIAKSHHGDDATRRTTLLVATAVFALMMLGKMVLHARIAHYGFAHALPAAVLLITVATGVIPRVIDNAGGRGALFRSAMIGVLFVMAGAHVSSTADFMGRKQDMVGEGGDAFRSDPRGMFVESARRRVAGYPPGTTLLVLPEGVMVNYLARTPSSIPHLNFMPVEIAMFGEESIIRALEEQPPDLVLLLHRNTSEYGAEFFGRDYGQAIMAWVRAHYRSVGRWGDPPLEPGTRFGMKLLARRESSAFGVDFDQVQHRHHGLCHPAERHPLPDAVHVLTAGEYIGGRQAGLR